VGLFVGTGALLCTHAGQQGDGVFAQEFTLHLLGEERCPMRVDVEDRADLFPTSVGPVAVI
jgi:hypothetical protein